MLKFEGNARHSAGTVVLLHAFPLSAAMWGPQRALLEAEGYGVVAPHVYGFDGSPSMPGWNMDDYARDLAELLDSLGCESVTVVGLSMGGYQAFSFWRLFPERTASLVLCDTRANGDTPEARQQRQEFRTAVETKGAVEAADRMVPNFFTRQTCDADPEMLSMVREIIIRQTATDISEAMRAIAERPDSSGLLPTITCPVLFLNGDADTVTTPEAAASMHAMTPGSKLSILTGAAHLSNLEQPDLFNRLLLEHLQTL
ncbi:MAG: alpha/beta fold hydrolase [Chlorobiaceae bacterium]|nr:alpha/beta fold hydrolase [Chlorobiaceae bacterium]NTW74834.1 alpha/beta fold hydrolase [Chlorobiaceae bacterium]